MDISPIDKDKIKYSVNKLINELVDKLNSSETESFSLDDVIKLSTNYIKILPVLITFSESINGVEESDDFIERKISSDSKALELSLKLLERLSQITD